MKKLCVSLIVVAMLVSMLAVCFYGCSRDDGTDEDINPNLDLNTPVALKIAGRYESWRALEEVIAKFEKKYPNCTITYEFVQSYYEVLGARLNSEEDKIDIFTSTNIQSSTAYVDNAFNLLSRPDVLDLSETYSGLVNNFKYRDAENTLYCIPHGGVMRGMYVNKTLLAKYNLSVPKTRTELLNCCEVLLREGYIPLFGGSGDFGQQLVYPYICSTIVNEGDYQTNYNKIANIDTGIAEMFRDAFTFAYDITEKGYYNYKVSENRGLKYSGDKAQVFLNVLKQDDGTYVKQDDIGQIAFTTDTQEFELALNKIKSDYHSAIEYEYIMAPVTDEGGYAYLSPSDGIAINKNSSNLEWALEFFDFFFKAENNKAFAKTQGCIPNVATAMADLNVSADRACTVDQVTFNYDFYRTVADILTSGFQISSTKVKVPYTVDMIGITKMNNPSYMNSAEDASGKKTYTIKYTLEEYIAAIEARFQEIKAAQQT